MGMAWIDNLQTGTYQIGSNVGFNASFTQGSANWVANAQVGSGTLQIIARTESRVTGSFSFVLEPLAGTGAAGTRTISGGTFDLPR
jgi:hypothetical protein